MGDKTLVNIRHSLCQKQNPMERPAETIDAILSLRPIFWQKTAKHFDNPHLLMHKFSQKLFKDSAKIPERREELAASSRVDSPVNAMLQSIGQAVPGLVSPITYSSQDPTVVLCEPIAIGGITNRAEEIATAVWHQLGRPVHLTWIEHWWKSDSPIRREFLCV